MLVISRHYGALGLPRKVSFLELWKRRDIWPIINFTSGIELANKSSMEAPASGLKINGSLNLFWLKSPHGKHTTRGVAGFMQRQDNCSTSARGGVQ